jgi:hypothetical protein
MMSQMPTCRARFAVFLALAVLATASPAGAEPRPAQDWRDLSPTQRYEALQHYWQHERLPQERQQDIEQRYERWRSLPSDERDRVRQNYERFRQLTPSERERFERKYEKWRQETAPRQ